MALPVQSLSAPAPSAKKFLPPPASPESTNRFRDVLSRTSRRSEAESPAPANAARDARKPTHATKPRRGRAESASELDEQRVNDAGRAEKTHKRAARDAEADEVSSPDEVATDAERTDEEGGHATAEVGNEDAAATAAGGAQMTPAPRGGEHGVPEDGLAEPTGAKLSALPGSAQAPGEATSAAGDASSTRESGFALPEDLTATADDATAEGDRPEAIAGKPPLAPGRASAALGNAPTGLGVAVPDERADAADATRSAQDATGTEATGGLAAVEELEAPAQADAATGTPSKAAADRPDALLPPPPDQPAAKGPAQTSASATLLAPEAPPEPRFAELNHDKVVTSVRSELLPNGGSMQIRLDPPELGDLMISVQVRNGVMTAAFQTSNDKATSLLSHSLSDLKAMLESQGVSVERLHVQQAPKDANNTSADGQPGSHQPTPEDREAGRREQQRKEVLQRMWQKLMKGGDPLDLVA